MSIAFIDLKAQQARIRDKVEAGFQTVLDLVPILWGRKSPHWKRVLVNGQTLRIIFPVRQEPMRYCWRLWGWSCNPAKASSFPLLPLPQALK